jgi:hypothetical protein
MHTPLYSILTVSNSLFIQEIKKRNEKKFLYNNISTDDILLRLLFALDSDESP